MDDKWVRMPKLLLCFLAFSLFSFTAFSEDTQTSTLPKVPVSDEGSALPPSLGDETHTSSLPSVPVSNEAQTSFSSATEVKPESSPQLGEEALPSLAMYPDRVHDMKGVHGYRDFFYPKFDAMRLAYCNQDRSVCGKEIANKYCKIMGYDKAGKIRKEHNVGLTKYAGTQLQCKGWKCDGFKWITCIESLEQKPTAVYYYRYRAFEAPRFDNYRVAWCYKDKRKGCGQRAATAFCRHMGYKKARGIVKDNKIAATRSLGDGTLCFGASCNGFRHITCYR